MEVVDVREGQEAVQRCVDRCVDWIISEGAEWIHVDHFVYEVDSAIGLIEGEEFVNVEACKAGALDAAEVSFAALDPEDLPGLAVEWIDLLKLGAGIASAEVGDAEVGT